MSRTLLPCLLVSLAGVARPAAAQVAPELPPPPGRAPAQRDPATPGLPPAIQLALQLRAAEDPEPLLGKDLNRHLRRQFFFPSRTHDFDPDPALVERLRGASELPERARMPEFLSAQEEGPPSIHSHLLNAIYMNASRLRYYAQRAGDLAGRSRRLSRLMMIGEAISLPKVKGWDERARAIREATGVDFVHHMRPLNPLPPQVPPAYRGVATKEQRRRVKALGQQLEDDLRQALERRDLRQVTELVHAAVMQLIAWEQEWGVHWHMSRHTIGSIGYTAIRGEEHADAEGMTELTFDYLNAIYTHTIDYGRQVDLMAQPLHAAGIGIVVNEFTDTSFLEAWDARAARERQQQRPELPPEVDGLARRLRQARQ